MAFPALSAILSVLCYTRICCWLRAWMNLSDTYKRSPKQPSDHPHFVSLAINLQLLWLLWMLAVTQWSGAAFDSPSTLSHIPQLHLQEDTALPCALCHVPNHYHHPSHPSWCQCLDLGKGFTAWGEINPKQIKKSKSKCLQVSIQVKAPVTAGADVFCYQGAQTREQLRS